MGAQGPDPLVSGTTTYSGRLQVIHGTNGQSLMVIAETGLIFGNAVNNPPVTFAGNGALSAAAFVPTGSTVPTQGMYAPSITSIGFAVNSAPTVTVTNSGSWTFNSPTATGICATFNAAAASVGVSVIGNSGVNTFTGLTPLGLRISGTAGNGDYQGIDFGNAGTGPQPVARIAANINGALGSILTFGTSNNFISGVTNVGMVVDQTGTVSILNVLDNVVYNAGTKATPQNSQSGNYTLQSTDQGGQLYFVGAGGATLTIPTTTVGLVKGTCVRIVNDSSGQVNVAFAGSGGLLWSPNNTTGTPRHIAAGSSAVIEKVTASPDRWWITGNGLT